jgi:hypothetical protein
MSSSRTSTEIISHVQFTYLSVSIHFVLVGAPLFLQDSLVFSWRTWPSQNSTEAGQRSSGVATPAEGVGANLERLINATKLVV